MGMASSQARLLSLTSRQHDVELKAQRLQADKLRLANDSDRVYNTYLEALNATKIQTKVYDSVEGDTFKDASLAMLVNSAIPAGNANRDPDMDYAQKPLFLQEISTGRLMITPEYAKYLGLDGDDKSYSGMTLDEYLSDVAGLNKQGEHGINTPTYPIKWDETDEIISYSGQNNTIQSRYSIGYNTAGAVGNTASADSTVYDDFKNAVTRTDTSGMTNITAVTSLTAGQSYKITDVAGLQKLKELSGANTANVTFVLANNIDMSSLNNWSGISNFNGTFNGNGYVISNLTGSQGLFQSTNGSAHIKNVGLKNVNITGSGVTAGISANNNSGTIENCYVTGSIKTTSMSYGVGGIVGDNTGSIIDCNVSMNIDSAGDCNGGISGHNSATITGCNATGSIKGYGAGGLVGHNNGTTIIKDCNTNMYVHNGTSTGLVIGRPENVDRVTIENVTYDPSVNTSLDITGIGPWPGNNSAFKENISVPSIKDDYTGDFYANVLAALLKSGAIDLATANDDDIEALENNVKNYVKNLYDSSTEDKTAESLLKIANINEYVYKYVKGTSTNTAFLNALKNDVMNGATAETTAANFQTKYTSDKHNASMNNDTGYDPIKRIPGEIIIPSLATIKKEIIAASNIAFGGKDNELKEADVDNFLKLYDKDNAEDMAYLAKISEMLYNYGQGTGNVSELLQTIQNYQGKAKYVQCGYPDIVDDPSHYNIRFSTSTSNVRNEYNKIPVKDMNNPIANWEWDWENEEVKKNVAKYYTLQMGFVIIGDDHISADYDNKNMHLSTDWLTNVINCGIAQFVDVDTENMFVENENGDKVFNEKSIRGTSLANETSLQEISNKEFLMKAEATYEKDMKKINKKETKADTDLSKLEAERTSIKTEQDSLKKVIQDNVDLTFKLFS